MTIRDFEKASKLNKFCLYPSVIDSNDCQLQHFVCFNDCDGDLKRHLASLILGRNFPPGQFVLYQQDVDWFISSFLEHYHIDPYRPWITGAVKEAIQLIQNGNPFTTSLFATIYLFGIVEFQAKWLLGFRHNPLNANASTLRSFENIGISNAMSKLGKQNSKLAVELNFINRRAKDFLDSRSDVKFPEDIKVTIAERLGHARNSLLHGQNHNFYSEGRFLAMLYILLILAADQ